MHSCCGGKMGTKIELRLCAEYQIDDVRTAIVNGLICEYLIGELSDALKVYHKQLDLAETRDDFKVAIDRCHEIGFADIYEWIRNKISAYEDLLGVVADLDSEVARAGVKSSGEVIADFQKKTTSFILSLANVSITMDSVEYDDLMTHLDKLIQPVLDEFHVIDETQFLIAMSQMKFDETPLEIEAYRNKFIEDKLQKCEKLMNSVSAAYDADDEKLHNSIIKSYSEFMKIANASLTDGEKVDKARQFNKFVNAHRLLLDKLENKMAEAHELKRQLELHRRKLVASQEADIDKLNKDLIENPHRKDIIERELDSLKYVNGEYFKNIQAMTKSINDMSKKIADQYHTLDKVEYALKAAIPGENEMKRYSQVIFKFNDLSVRLTLAKSQVDRKNKDFITVIDTAIKGLGVLMQQATEGKDLFMRNSLLSATFNTVNAMYDLVDNENNSTEITQINFVTNKLSEYTTVNAIYSKELIEFRKACNNAIRDISITMGKPLNVKGMVDLIGYIDVAIQQLDIELKVLDTNNRKQVDLLGAILRV